MFNTVNHNASRTGTEQPLPDIRPCTQCDLDSVMQASKTGWPRSCRGRLKDVGDAQGATIKRTCQ